MKLAASIVCFLFALSCSAPLLVLVKIAWADRKLPRGHPDYRNIFLGKGITWVFAFLLAAIVAGSVAVGVGNLG